MNRDVWSAARYWRGRALDADEAIRQLRDWLHELDPTFDGSATDYVVGERTKQAVRTALSGRRRKRP